ncbi:MAG: GMC family oxidoreductase [Cyanobacteria bacterium J06648_1]
MSQNKTQVQLVDCQTVANTVYDVVIVGAGISGSIVAKELSEQGQQVLILEAGSYQDLTLAGFQEYVNTFYTAVEKDNNSPFPRNPNAPSPRSPDIRKLIPGQTDAAHGYLVQQGPLALDSSYTKVTGGTTMHWEGKTPRMLPDDFKLRSLHGQGLDWPIEYEEIMPFYRIAEHELGVSGSVEDQKAVGTPFKEGYVYPMHNMPASYLDQKVAEKLDDTEVELQGETYKVEVNTFPQARNGVPNPDYNQGKGFIPDKLTSVHPVEYGERCQGNANCTPICPVQAKYDARRTLSKAFKTNRVHLLSQAVASKVEVHPENGHVTAVHFKHYQDKDSPQHTTHVAKGRLYVMAANAVENARLLLASGLHSTSGLVGKNLMDHPYMLAWGLMPEVTGTMRGPICTSGISTFRRGSFRNQQAAFAIDIHNDGWGWATGSPYSEVLDIVNNKNKYGAELRQELVSRISRQLLLAYMIECPAEQSNQISIDPKYTDRLGNYRPVVSFNVPDYCRQAFAYGRHFSRLIFQRAGVEDCTHYDPSDYGYFTYKGEGYTFRGGNHYAGTHVMGTNKQNSVVDQYQKTWDHRNLYLVGAGSMPTIGTSNTSLTLAALAFMSTQQMMQDLQSQELRHAVI